MKANYTDMTLRRVNEAWREYKAVTGCNQAQAAKSLSINQSAFSQYLRGPEYGGIPLNTDFLSKFASLVRKDLTYFGVDSSVDLHRPDFFSLDIKYSLSGAVLHGKRCLVQSVVPNRNCYGVLVDMGGFVLSKGAIIIVDPDAEIREHDGVICKQGNGPIKAGQIVNAEDGWRIISPTWSTVLAYKAKEEEIVHRIIGDYFPEGGGDIYHHEL
ncbi:MAG: hypothetical protein V7739_16765 [Motiliproteus sp.]